MRACILQRILTNYSGKEELWQMNAENMASSAPSILHLSGHLYLSESPPTLPWIPHYHYLLCFRTLQLLPIVYSSHFLTPSFRQTNFQGIFISSVFAHTILSIWCVSPLLWWAFTYLTLFSFDVTCSTALTTRPPQSDVLSQLLFHMFFSYHCYISNHIISSGFTSKVCFLCTYTFKSSEWPYLLNLGILLLNNFWHKMNTINI